MCDGIIKLKKCNNETQKNVHVHVHAFLLLLSFVHFAHWLLVKLKTCSREVSTVECIAALPHF